jgi:cytochrome bd-type quinol oxidase subunit 2
MDRISVNIISPKLSDKGRRAEIYMFISFGLLFLAYPINLLTGEGGLYISIICIIFLNMIFGVAYYYSVDKYVAIGQIIFDFLWKLHSQVNWTRQYSNISIR